MSDPGTDQRFLREEQYRDDSNFRARIDLHDRFSTNLEPWHRWVFDRLALEGDADVLEVGCGPGELWAQNLDRIPQGWSLTLTDLSSGMLDAARERVGDRAAYVVADLQDLPFEDESFAAAIANHMLYHVPERRKGLAELARVLRSGGRLIVATNGRGHLQELDPLRSARWEVEFLLEEAGDELAEFFVDVRLEHYPCALEVTEVEPILAFIRSAGHEPAEGAAETVAREIERRGSFHVTKSTGLFTARKP